MAKIKVEEVFEKLSMQLQSALKDALRDTNHSDVNDRDLFKAFQKAVRMRCQTWENVADSSVDSGY